MIIRKKWLCQLFQLMTLSLSLLLISTFAMAESNTATANQWLIFSDLHFDPFLTCQMKKPCDTIVALQNAPPNQWDEILTNAENGLMLYRRNGSASMLNAIFSRAAAVSAQYHIKTIIILGDWYGHYYHRLYYRYAKNPTRAGYRAFAQKTLFYLSNQLTTYFSHEAIYAALGNNDSYHGDYYAGQDAEFYRDWNLIQSSWHQSKSVKRSAFGYESVDFPDLNLKLLMLNTNFFSNHARGKDISKLASDEMAWLKQSLDESNEKHENTMIAMHIPPYLDWYLGGRFKISRIETFWDKGAVDQFDKMVLANESVISGFLAGHLHSSWEFPFPGSIFHRSIKFHVMPAVTPVYGNDPAFERVEVSPVTHDIKLLQLYTYSLPQLQ